MFYGYEKMLKFVILGAFIISIVWVGILEYIFGIAQLEREYGKNLIGVLTMLPGMCLMVVYSYYDEKSKETPEEKTKTEKIEPEKKKESEVIVVKEIKGERNIIIDVVVKIIVFIIGLVLTGFLTVFLRYIFGLSGVIISLLGCLPLIFAIQYCFTTNDKNKDKE